MISRSMSDSGPAVPLALEPKRRTSEPGITPWITAAISCRRVSIGRAAVVLMECILMVCAHCCSALLLLFEGLGGTWGQGVTGVALAH